MNRTRRAFSLLELLVVIAIIVVLVGLVFITIRGFTSAAQRTDSLASLRQLALAHSAYATDHKGRFMPGFVNTSRLETDIPLPTRLPNEEFAAPPDMAQTYVLRMFPYLDNAWTTLYTDLRDTNAISELQAEYDAGEIEEIVFNPSFGMNTIFIGGDTDHGGVTDYNPWQSANPTIAATRMSEVRTPAQLILFGASSRAAEAGTGGGGENPAYDASEHNHGWHELRAPRLLEQQWNIVDKGDVTIANGLVTPAGLPISRTGDGLVPIVHLDGHAEVLPVAQLFGDMRLWAPYADDARYEIGN